MPKQYRGYLFTFFFLAALLVGMLGSSFVFAKGHTQEASPQKAALPTCGTWSVVASPNVGSSLNDLGDVAVVSARNIWAVGEYSNSSSTPPRTLIEHWNGTNWSVVTSPNVGSSLNLLFGVAAVSANDVWAVGGYTNSAGFHRTLIEHWDGRNWSVVTSPNVGSRDNELYSVAVVSARDIWAVGNYTKSTRQTLTLHWDGTSWSVMASPNVGSSDNYLQGVAAVSARNIWAVGNYSNSSTGPSLIEHWNGTSWSIVASPNVGSVANNLRHVAAVSANDVWAVGDYLDSTPFRARTLIEHWNGKSWSVVASPNVGSSDNYLQGVAAVSARNIWTVGLYFTSSTGPRTLIEHWDGRNWSVVASPNVGSSVLRGVAQVPASSNVWVVGNYRNSNANAIQTLIEFYC